MSQPPPADGKVERQFHFYPWWSPRFWHGMPLGVWLPLVAEHRAAAAPHKWGQMATVTAAAAFNSLCEQLSEARFRRRLRTPTPTAPPVFIIGHWRSGTTLLHELLMLDEAFCCPNTYQCYAPGHFLLTEGVVSAAIEWMIPKQRPMDDVVAGWDRPQEDEFALMNLGAPSPYRRMAFPRTASAGPVALDLATLSPADLDRWRRALRSFLARLAVRDPRRPVLKSPPHTARTAVLAEMFPGAKFVHMVRDPFVVFPSTMRLWKSLHLVQGMQVDDGSNAEAYVFAAFEQMYAAFERDRAALPPGSLEELRYEDLVADPVGRLREVYERLDLGDFARVRPALEAQARSMKRYRTNDYRIEPRLVDEIARRWRPFIDRYGYRAPDLAPAPAPAPAPSPAA
ncbi:MAG: sulfotransferase family protein [Planctomycetaceae bacterium]